MDLSLSGGVLTNSKKLSRKLLYWRIRITQKPFILEVDASLKGLGTVLSQKGDDNEIRVVTYASRSLRPSEKSMRDYSLAKN